MKKARLFLWVGLTILDAKLKEKKMEKRCSLLGMIFLSAVLNAQVEVIDTIWLAPREGNGIEPVAVGVNHTTNKVYVVNQKSKNISVIDGHTNTVITTIQANDGKNLKRIAVNPVSNRIYVTDGWSNVYVIDGKTDSIVTTITIPFTNGVGDLRDIAVNPKTNIVYVAKGLKGKICIIDGTNDTIITETSWNGYELEGIAIDTHTNQIYVTNYQQNEVLVIDGKEYSLTEIIRVGKEPRRLAIDPFSNLIYVTNFGTNTISVIDRLTNSLISTIETFPHPYEIAVSTDYIYVTFPHINVVSVIDKSADSIVAIIKVEDSPRGISVARDIYVVNSNSNSLSIINSSTHKIESTLLLGCEPLSMGLNLSTNRIYVTDKSSTNFFIINEKNNQVVKRISTGRKGIHDIKVNPNTNKIYGVCHTKGKDIKNKLIDSLTNLAYIKDHLFEICVHPATNRVYITSFYRNGIWVLEGRNNSILKVIPTGVSPLGMDINYISNKIYVTNFWDTTLSVIDGMKNLVTTNISVTQGTKEISVNPNTKKIYVTNYYNNSVLIIDETTNLVAKEVKIGKGPIGLAVDVNKNRVYVVSIDNSLSIINGEADSVEQVISLSEVPQDIIINENMGRIYVSSSKKGVITVLEEKKKLKEKKFVAQKAKLDVWPNPFVESTVITYQLPQEAIKRGPKSLFINIYDLEEKIVKSFSLSNYPLSVTKILWDGRDNDGKKIESGLYFCRLEAYGKVWAEKICGAK
jgi:YVTN family beta-propeller protein